MQPIFPTLTLHTLKMKCYNLFLQSQNLSASRSNSNPNTNVSSPSTPNPVPLISPLIISVFVERVILSDPTVIDILNQFKSQFSSATTLDFYTDGSVIDLLYRHVGWASDGYKPMRPILLLNFKALLFQIHCHPR